MKLLGLEILDTFKKHHALARKTIDAWMMEVQKANWKSPKSVKERYKSADFLSGNRVIFNIKGNSFRLVVKINYSVQIVVVQWIGTHAEYDRKKF